jgi:hypothetical protein|tara:strand:+ start:1681 stop:1791 length:111 start_codon:yes stop_codon:yes gene_type:complete
MIKTKTPFCLFRTAFLFEPPIKKARQEAGLFPNQMI